jgi:hypothetical protein
MVRFNRHVAHIVVPKCNDGANATTVTCEGVVRWVLGAAGTIGMVDHPDLPSSNHNDDDEAARRSRAREEWNKGEERMAAMMTIPLVPLSLSSLWRRLNPSYRRDPTLLPR